MARQNLETELIAAERRFTYQRNTTLAAGRKPVQQVYPHLGWMLPASGLVLGFGFGWAVGHRMLPTIWYAGSVTLRLLTEALIWQDTPCED